MTSDKILIRMKEDIILRGYSSSAQEHYIPAVRAFFKHFEGENQDELKEDQVRSYLLHMANDLARKPQTINTHNAALRFLFDVTLDRPLRLKHVPRMKAPKHLPRILSREELREVFHRCDTLRQKAFFLLGYGSGLRSSEIVNLKASDIEAKNMRILVREGKGKRDRYAMLSQITLDTLREYWRESRPNSPNNYLFPGTTAEQHASRRSLYCELVKVLGKGYSPHTLRHCFATHMLEDGVNLLRIQNLLGHACIRSTMVYLHLTNTTQDIVSPADKLLS